MGLVYADVELINGSDLAMVRRHRMGEDEVKRTSIKIRVDLGSLMLAINENIQEQLQLSVLDKRKAQFADNSIKQLDVVGPVEFRFKNRRIICQAIVLPGDSEPLLGAIPLEDMDVIIDPQRQQLIVHPDHPYFAQVKLK